MSICLRIFFALLLGGASIASAQVWQIPTVHQVLPVPSDGSTVNFPAINLVAGMKYRVQASGRVNVSNGSDIADACYYVNIFPFNPNTIAVSMKLRNSPTSEDWFYTFWNTAGLQSGYQSSHNYGASIPSLGSALSFRFFDRADPPSNYYSDNSGSILIDVARETPGIAIQHDTIDFGNVRVGIPKTLTDSIEGYGMEKYIVSSVKMLGTSFAKFGASSQIIPPFPLDTTDEFRFTYSPTGNGRDSAEFHIFSSNGFGADKEKIIYLYGNGISSQLSFSPDTLDFGNIRTGTTKTLPDSIINLNLAAVNIISITAETPGSVFSVTGAPLSVLARSGTPVAVKFAPLANGKYTEKFDVLTDDGSTFHFYAKGGAGVPIPEVQYDTLYFGKVIIGQSRTLTDQFGNDYSLTGPDYTPYLNVVSTQNTNPAEYKVIGNLAVKPYDHGHSEIYTVIFTPQAASLNHNGKFIITYDDGATTTIYFEGLGHTPLDVKLEIDTTYFVSAGQTIDVTQKLIMLGDPLDSAIIPVRSLTEQITFDASLVDFVSASKAALINSNQWNLTANIGLPGTIDVSINSPTLNLDTAGHLLILTFKAHDDAKVKQYTYLVQNSDSIKFDTPLEPLAISSTGKITISDICSPVPLTTGNFATSIEQNNPNPFNPTTHLHYAIGKNSDGTAVGVKITLFDELGRFAGTLVNEPKTPGVYDFIFDGSSYSSGMYIYVFQAGDHTERKTMVLAK